MDDALVNRHRWEELARCRELLGMAVTTQVDMAPTAADPIPPPVPDATVTPTPACPRCGEGRMVVVATFPPMTLAEEIRASVAAYPGMDSP